MRISRRTLFGAIGGALFGRYFVRADPDLELAEALERFTNTYIAPAVKNIADSLNLKAEGWNVATYSGRHPA